MNTVKKLDELTRKHNGYIRLVDAQRLGISKYEVLKYVQNNKMEKLAPGIYMDRDAWEDRLYMLQLRNRKIIYSHETALFMHNLSDREPFSHVVTVERGYNAKHLRDKGIVVHTVKTDWFELGLMEKVTFAGNSVRVYDMERCICDIIRNKNKMDIWVFQQAITSYFRSEEKSMYKLSEYAAILGVSDKVRQYTEVLL